MLHYFNWKIVEFSSYKILKNNSFGVKISYSWKKREWDFFLFPIIDQNHNTIHYLAFDSEKQLNLFELFLKISGIWPKIANYITTMFDIEEIKNAIENTDVKFFKQIPWIWAKTAKKIIIELKDKIEVSDLEKIENEEKIKKEIVKSVVSLWYSKTKIENFLKNYKWDIFNKQQVIQEIIKNL